MTDDASLPEPLVDAARLSAWVEAHPELGGYGAVEVERLAAGHSNLTFVVRREGAPSEWILRRPPRGPLLPTAHDVLREFRVLDELSRGGAKVRVPQVLAACDDTDVIGAPFYLMEKIDGIVIRDTLPDWLANTERDTAARHTIGLELVDALAELHLAPWESLTAAGIGKPAGYLERQLRRWIGQREGIKDVAASFGVTARELPDYDAVRDWLQACLPTSPATAIVHGDYKLDNVIVRGGNTPPQVVAIVDWEMATVGDPLADLGYMLSFWVEATDDLPFHEVVTAAPGFATRTELIDRYEEQTQIPIDRDQLPWYITLAIWKLAILLEASYHRHLAGTTDDPFFETLDKGVPALLARARDVCGA